MKTIILLGPPGSGKGTQAARLTAKASDWIHVSTGNLFRAEIQRGTAEGKRLKEILDAGKLVPDETTNEVFASQIRLILEKNPSILLLDGYPRKKSQSIFLKNLRKSLPGMGQLAVVELLAGEEMLVERLSGRLVNPKTGRVYHVKHNPPKVEGVCDEDGSPLIQRADDQPDVIRSRYKLYMEERQGILDGLGPVGENPIQVDADQSPEQIEGDLIQAIENVSN